MDSWMVSHRLDGSITRSVGPGVTPGRLGLLGQQRRQRRQLTRPVPHVVARHDLPALRGRRRQCAHGFEGSGRGVDGHRLQRRIHPHPLLGDRRAERVGVERLLLCGVQRGRDVVDAVGGHQPAGVLLQHRDLVGGRDGERVDPVVRHPARRRSRRVRRPARCVRRSAVPAPRHPNRPAGGVGRHDGVQFGVRRETPGAVDDHPHRQADLAVDDGGLQFTVTHCTISVVMR